MIITGAQEERRMCATSAQQLRKKCAQLQGCEKLRTSYLKIL